MNGELLSVEAAQATVLAGLEPLAELESLAPEAALGRVLAAPLVAPDVVAAVGQLRDGRLRDPGGGCRRRHRGRPGPPDPRRRGPRRRRRRTPGSWVARPCGSPPVRRCRRARTPWFRSSRRRRSTAPATPARAAARRSARCRPRASCMPPSPPGTRSVPPAPTLRRGRSSQRPGSGSRRRSSPSRLAPESRPWQVRRRPVVAVLATGDELRTPGTALGPAGIPDANGPGLRALVREAGGEPLDLGIAVDRLDDVERRLRRGVAEADLVVVSGGVSVGPYDVVRLAFDAVGPHQPVAGRGPARQAVRLRAGRDAATLAGPAVRTARQSRLVVRDVRAVRAAGDPPPGRRRSPPPPGGPRGPGGAGRARAWGAAASSA